MADPHDDTDDTVTTWRDMADQLTAEQRAILSALERAGDRPDTLLFTARELAAENLASVVMFSDVAPPPDAARLFGWQQDHGAGWFREFAGTTRRVGRIALHVAGRQFRDGRCERWLVLSAKDFDELTPAQARDLATALCEAADEAERPT